MKSKLLIAFVLTLAIVPLVLFGCKGKTEKISETSQMEVPEATTPTTQEEMPSVTEPSQTVATETIPPTAAPQLKEKVTPVVQVSQDRNKDIQKALKNAGFYTGSVDGKIGPKTKKAVEEFQKSKGLKADGKVGPKTWIELEKYLTVSQ
jgi:peptidoglycan hydrolase-like protein with peptidoglycan-binding domain